MKNGTYINSRFEDAILFEIEFTPKGTKERIKVYVWATNGLNASQTLILKHIWGKQHSVNMIQSSSLLRNK